MADYWKSNKKHLCPICNFWIPDNPGSRTKHERSESHRAKVALRVKQAFVDEKNAKRKHAETSELLQKLSDAASSSIEKDAKLFQHNLPLNSSTDSKWITLTTELGERYLFNPTTNETKWVDLATTSDPAPINYESSDNLGQTTTHNHGWFTCRGVDGRFFYKNEITGKTQGKKPLELGGGEKILPKPVSVKPTAPVFPRRANVETPLREPDSDISGLLEIKVDPNTGLGVWVDGTEEPNTVPETVERKPFMSFSFKKSRS